MGLAKERVRLDPVITRRVWKIVEETYEEAVRLEAERSEE